VEENGDGSTEGHDLLDTESGQTRKHGESDLDDSDVDEGSIDWEWEDAEWAGMTVTEGIVAVAGPGSQGRIFSTWENRHLRFHAARVSF
jgi:hypothetical protein